MMLSLSSVINGNRNWIISLFSSRLTFQLLKHQAAMATTVETTPKYNDYFNEVGYYSNDSSVTTLIMGAPGTKMRVKCAEIFQKASQHRLEREKENGYLFQYGPTMGDWEFCFQLSQFLTKNYKQQVSMKNIMATAGASQGVYMCASLFFKKGDVVFVEDPTYFIASKMFENDLQLNIVPVAMDSDGINVSKLEELFKKHVTTSENSGKGPFSAMVYVIPAYQNPLGMCYSEERCKQLVEFARKNNLLIFCDDVYNLLSYSNESPVKPLFYFDNPSPGDKGHVISNCTFSKLLGPGLRLGWFQAHENILDSLRNSGLVKSGGCLNHYTSGILASALELELLDELMPLLKQDYGTRVKKVCRILSEKLPQSCTFFEPKGGFFVWITLPDGTNADNVINFSKTHHNVTALPGNRCSVAGNFKNCVRIAFTYQDEQILLESVGRLCEAITQFLNGKTE